MKIVPFLLAATLVPLFAQDIKMPANIDKLASIAQETVDVSLDGAMLKLAGRFISNRGDEAKAKAVLNGLQSITVKSFEFARDGQYDMADVDAIRSQLKTPQWSRIVGVKSQKNGDNVDVYFKDGGNGNLGGIVVVAAEPRQLTIVSIVGNIDPTQLGELGGQFGMPKLDLGVHIKGGKGEK